MVVRSEQAVSANAVTKPIRGKRAAVVAAIAATLMLLVGLVSPVAAAAPDAPTGSDIAQPAALTADITWDAAATGDLATSFDLSISPPVAGAPSTNVTSPLVISGLAGATEYTVTIVAQNADGTSLPLTRTFTTHGVPNAPVIGAASPVGSTSASVAWTASTNDGGSPITAYEVRVDGAGNWTPVGVTSPVQVDGLAVGSHTFEIRAANAIGKSGPSQPSNAVLVNAPVTPPGKPTNVSAARIGITSSANITWIAPAVTGGASITSYDVRIDGAGGWSSAGTASPHTVSGLAVGSHTFEIRAVNSAGPGAASDASDPVSITAPPPAVPGTPGTPTVTNTGSTINVSWTVATGTVDDYVVTLDRAGQTTQTRTVTGTSASFTLQAAGDYAITVTARNAGGPGLSSTKTFTLTLAAEAVVNLAASVDGANQVNASWDAPGQTGGGVAQYIVSVVLDAGGAVVQQQTVSGSTFSASFTGLPSGNYRMTVVPVNAAGSGSPAESGVFSIVVAPGSPLNVRTSAASTIDGTATVTWDPPANNGNGTISAYVVTMSPCTLAACSVEVAATARSATFAGLPIGKLTARVQARNAQGLSAAGTAAEFRSNRAVHPFDTRDAFVRQAFQDLYKTTPTAQELSDWMGVTTADGSNAPGIITIMMQRDRFETRRQVSRLYFAYFLRVPDELGQNYWADLMDRGVLDLQGVSDEFARSPEFINTYGGLNDAEFVVVVYNNVLLRTPDIGGFNYWLGQRNNGLTRGGVMTWFTEGDEYIALSLPAIDTSLAHISLLGRAPTKAEYDIWLTRINASTASLQTLVAAIWASDEYAARVTPN